MCKQRENIKLYSLSCKYGCKYTTFKKPKAVICDEIAQNALGQGTLFIHG